MTTRGPALRLAPLYDNTLTKGPVGMTDRGLTHTHTLARLSLAHTHTHTWTMLPTFNPYKCVLTHSHTHLHTHTHTHTHTHLSLQFPNPTLPPLPFDRK